MSVQLEPTDLPSKCPMMVPFQSAVQDYASRLRQFVPMDWNIRAFCDRYPHRFQELCMVHLSFLIDIPWNLSDPKLNFLAVTSAVAADSGNHQLTNSSGKIGAFKRFLSGCRANNNSQIKTDEIPPKLLDNLICLINRLDTDEACSVEGIFRKAGHALRKRQLEDLILQHSFDLSTIDWSQYTFHDLASTLKSLLINLPVPVFTERLMPLFLQVSQLRKYCDTPTPDLQMDLTPNSCLNERQHIQLIESKQLKALRILVQLLPPSNYRLLESLIRLLSRVKHLQTRNRMSSTCLGTVFGPVLLPQGILYDPVATPKNSRPMPSDFQERCQQLSSMMKILIDTGVDIFHLPRSLAEDISANCPELLTPVEMVDTPKLAAALHHHTTPTSSLNSNTPPGTLKKQSRKIRDISMFLSPKLSKNRPNMMTTAADCSDSPPLRTGIRFATPTLVNPMRYLHNHHYPHSHHQPWELSHSIDHSPIPASKHSMFDALTDLTSTTSSFCSHWIKSSGSSSSSLGSPDLSDEGSNHGPVVNPTVGGSVHTVNPAELAFLPPPSLPCSTATPTIPNSRLKFSPNQPKLVSATYVNPEMNSELKNCPKRKFGRRRRFTELRLPSSMHHSSGGGGGGHRRPFFSPCPPIPLLPFKRFGSDKRDHPTSAASLSPSLLNLASTKTTTSGPSW